ncbi:hypothetical protein M5689_012957 [Euphorbia peplus]|nr:hypothetical protein M5689_012957 [Euphorbia peplus]
MPRSGCSILIGIWIVGQERFLGWNVSNQGDNAGPSETYQVPSNSQSEADTHIYKEATISDLTCLDRNQVHEQMPRTITDLTREVIQNQQVQDFIQQPTRNSQSHGTMLRVNKARGRTTVKRVRGRGRGRIVASKYIEQKNG